MKLKSKGCEQVTVLLEYIIIIDFNKYKIYAKQNKTTTKGV